MSSLCTMKFFNTSNYKFYLGYWVVPQSTLSGGINQQPQDTIHPIYGSSEYSVTDADLGGVDEMNFSCSYFHSEGMFRFALRIHIPLQGFFNIGSRPYWYYAYDDQAGDDTEPAWISMESTPAETYIFPTSFKGEKIPYEITVIPTSKHSSLILEAHIKNAPKPPPI